MRGAIVVEGQGELEAAHNLVSRLSRDLSLDLVWTPPRRFTNLHQERGIRRAAEVQRLDRGVEALLILRDEDDGCPAQRGPEAAGWLREQRLPFPTALVLLCREYETLFLPCVSHMAGRPLVTGGVERPGLLSGTRFDGDPERVRGVKEWLSRHFPQGRNYKPTLDQLPMTRMIDFSTLRAAGLPCFGTLERALRFLAESVGTEGLVYPAA